MSAPPSHTYDFERKDLIRLVCSPLIPVAVFAALMHLGAWLHVLPRPRSTLDVDRTILIHQVEASRSKEDAEVLLLGDSSCLMDVSARQLSEQLGRPVLNLGLFSYLDLNASAALVRQFTAANPGRLQAVALLMHPEALRRATPESYYVKLLQSFLDGDDYFRSGSARDTVSQILGLEIFRGRILSRALPTPLPGAWGRRYAFSCDLEEYLTQNGGSAVDPEPHAFQGNPEYRLARQFESASRAFRSAVPPGAKLFVGITPAPAGFVGRDYAATRQQMLDQWSQWLQADVVLEELPATLPDQLFAKTTHLNEAGAKAYTITLARSLQPHLR